MHAVSAHTVPLPSCIESSRSFSHADREAHRTVSKTVLHELKQKQNYLLFAYAMKKSRLLQRVRASQQQQQKCSRCVPATAAAAAAANTAGLAGLSSQPQRRSSAAATVQRTKRARESCKLANGGHSRELL